MREYKVFLKGVDEPLSVKAEDFNLISADGPSVGAFLNFWQYIPEENNGRHDGEDVTVAAIPLEEVRYVLSV